MNFKEFANNLEMCLVGYEKTVTKNGAYYAIEGCNVFWISYVNKDVAVNHLSWKYIRNEFTQEKLNKLKKYAGDIVTLLKKDYITSKLKEMETDFEK